MSSLKDASKGGLPLMKFDKMYHFDILITIIKTNETLFSLSVRVEGVA